MIKGLYTSASSMLATKRNLDIISNNLANVNNTGFKKDNGIKESFPEVLIQKVENGQTPEELGGIGSGVHLEESYTDHTQGEIKSTSNNLDFAIQGEGFFEVDTPEGIRYTRNGNFTLNNEGNLVTQSGYEVLNQSGEPIAVESGDEIKIDGQGNIISGSPDNDQQIQIVDFEEKQALTHAGEDLYNAEEAAVEPAENHQILQGYLETSNVRIVEEMAKMIQTNRHYEANQKVISTIDNTLDQAVNRVGRLG